MKPEQKLAKEVWNWAEKWYDWSFTEEQSPDAIRLKKILEPYVAEKENHTSLQDGAGSPISTKGNSSEAPTTPFQTKVKE